MPVHNVEAPFRIYIKNHTKPAPKGESPEGVYNGFVSDYRKGALAVVNSGIVLPPGATHVEMEQYDRIDDEARLTDAIKQQVHTLKFIRAASGLTGLLYGFRLTEQAFDESGFELFTDGMSMPLNDHEQVARVITELRAAENGETLLPVATARRLTITS